MFLQFLLQDMFPHSPDDIRPRQLIPRRSGIRHADDSHVGHSVMRQEMRLDFDRGHLQALVLDEFLHLISTHLPRPLLTNLTFIRSTM